MKENREEYQNEKEKREKGLLAYADMIQSAVQLDSSEVIRQLVEERKRQRLTQQELFGYNRCENIEYSKV